MPSGYRAHPRVCGENGRVGHWGGFLSGSSPRVRGKRRRATILPAGSRLIPACAGKTSRQPLRRMPWRAHPRVCGENYGSIPGTRPDRGSSPRVRGKPGATPDSSARSRLIPACAGKTPTIFQLGSEHRAHPRVCGENRASIAWSASIWGSSPRVRGKHGEWMRAYMNVGLIPACAGKTLALLRFHASSRAHPRVCGENVSGCVSASSVWGSSPRVRGKQTTPVESSHCAGLIPACAGKTSRRAR